MNSTKFCCCNHDKCNLNFSDAYVPADVPPTDNIPLEDPLFPLIYIVLGVVFLVSILFLAAMTYLCWRMKPKKSDVESCQQPMPPPAEYSLEKLKMLNLIG